MSICPTSVYSISKAINITMLFFLDFLNAVPFIIYFLVCNNLTLKTWLARNSVCRRGWFWTHCSLPAFASQVKGWHVCYCAQNMISFSSFPHSSIPSFTTSFLLLSPSGMSDSLIFNWRKGPKIISARCVSDFKARRMQIIQVSLITLNTSNYGSYTPFLWFRKARCIYCLWVWKQWVR